MFPCGFRIFHRPASTLLVSKSLVARTSSKASSNCGSVRVRQALQEERGCPWRCSYQRQQLPPPWGFLPASRLCRGPFPFHLFYFLSSLIKTNLFKNYPTPYLPFLKSNPFKDARADCLTFLFLLNHIADPFQISPLICAHDLWRLNQIKIPFYPFGLARLY